MKKNFFLKVTHPLPPSSSIYEKSNSIGKLFKAVLKIFHGNLKGNALSKVYPENAYLRLYYVYFVGVQKMTNIRFETCPQIPSISRLYNISKITSLSNPVHNLPGLHSFRKRWYLKSGQNTNRFESEINHKLRSLQERKGQHEFWRWCWNLHLASLTSLRKSCNSTISVITRWKYWKKRQKGKSQRMLTR